MSDNGLPPKTPTRRIRRSKIKDLTLKQSNFVYEYAQNANGRQAIINAGYNPKDVAIADRMSSNLLANEKVKAGLTNVLQRLYPDLDLQRAGYIQQAVEAPIGDPRETPGAMTWKDKLAWERHLADLHGDKAPAKSVQVTAKVSEKFRLPEE